MKWRVEFQGMEPLVLSSPEVAFYYANGDWSEVPRITKIDCHGERLVSLRALGEMVFKDG